MTPDGQPETAAGAPGLDGVLETSLYVADLPRSHRFYADVMGLPALFADDRLVALDAGRRTVLLLFLAGGSSETIVLPMGTIPPHDAGGRIHVAFAVPAEALAAWEERLAAHGVAVEGRAEWPRGGRSLYFRDPDGHLLELATPGLWATY